MKRTIIISFISLLVLTNAVLAADINFEAKSASPATLKAQQTFRELLAKDTGRDARFVQRGFIATFDNPVVYGKGGKVVVDPSSLDWVKGKAPNTVNPSLWRQMKLLRVHGLFEVVGGVYQLRGLDGSNMTLVRGETGWVIIDPMMTTETAAQGMALVAEHLGKYPVKAVIYTHSHPDHFGGVRGVLGIDDDEQIKDKIDAQILAPEHLVEEAVSEYLMAGNAMGRRVSYQFATGIELGPQGRVGGGIVSVAADGTIRLIPPTDIIRETGETRTIDGVTLEFQMVPDTEAPAEMNVFLPAQKVFYISEFATCTMHNIQTPRGALVRDALQWADYLTEALQRYGEASDAIAAGHCWPRFGNDEVKNYLRLQRDNYKFIHDQTVRRMNLGETPTEIAEQLIAPEEVASEWSNRGYYGTLRHNAKGVYQRYMGWWDGNPAHLDMLPPTERGQRYVKALGGAKAVLKAARSAMKAGDYRWSAELLNHLVFADADNAGTTQKKTKALLADSYEQLAYQSESAVWRNYYLSGAAELRGAPAPRFWLSMPDLAAAIPTRKFLDVVATRLNPEKIGEHRVAMMLKIKDTNEELRLGVRNAVMVIEQGETDSDVAVTLNGNKQLLMGLFMRKLPLAKMEAAGLVVSGDREILETLLNAIDVPPDDFNIVVP